MDLDAALYWCIVTSLRLRLRLGAVGLLLAVTAMLASAQVRLADESDRAALRAWFTLLADAQFEQASPEITDCAALVRFAFREALRAHTPEWRRRVNLPFAPQFPDVRSAPRADGQGWALFRISDGPSPRYGEFADAKTIVGLNAVPAGRDVRRARPGDLLYFRQPSQRQPDHLMVYVGASSFDREHSDWVVYHTGPSDEGPGDVRKARVATLLEHPSPRWRPIQANPQFAGVFRLAALDTP
jgi:uncharacterized protein YfaT (DUF1175 family)